jgi:O-antigen/teichoic acid export membrane protein
VISSDIVLLGFLTTDHQVGLYSAAYRVAFLLMAVAASVSAAFLPSYARAAQDDTADTKSLVETSMGTAMLIGAPLVAGVMVTARPLISLLFGAEYTEATVAVQLLSLSVGMVFLYWCVSTLLIVAHRTRLYAAIHGTSAAVNIMLNLFLIPRFGIAGAAAATLIAEASILIPGFLILRQMHALPRVRPILAPVAAAAGMSVVILAIGSAWPLAAQIALGGGVYLALVTLLGVRPFRDTRLDTRRARV